MKFAYQTKTKQYNDQLHLVCVDHGFVVNQTQTLQLRRQRIKKFDLKVQYVTCKYYSNGIAYLCLLFLVFMRYITVHVFCKIWRKYSSNAHWWRLVSVLAGFLFDIQISLILKIQSIYVYKSSWENLSLLAEAKRHAVWKMIGPVIEWPWYKNPSWELSGKKVPNQKIRDCSLSEQNETLDSAE